MFVRLGFNATQTVPFQGQGSVIIDHSATVKCRTKGEMSCG